ncbi:hypothetical protein QBC39DRAFT_350430 [Podospora conica]|nr:hypothetical protein QBC39DRAFT_350430 [Schizothecium conicum]
MKTTSILALFASITAVIATPAGEAPQSANNLPKLAERAACYHASTCSWLNGAKCEQYCRQWGQHVGVSRMEKCSLLNDKRCCCTA